MKKQTNNRAFICGVGMTKFMKPSPNNPEYDELAQTAARRALRDSGLKYSSICAFIAGYIYADATSAQRYFIQII